MSFLSLFRSKPKSKARTAAASTPTGASSSLLPNDSVIIVNIPSSSLLADDISRRIGDQRSPSSQSVSSSLWDRVSEGGKEEADTDESRMEMEEADTRKLGRAILGVGEITELMEECGGVVRERGSTTLGIFRPYRTAESPLEIRKLSLLFLAYAQDFQTKDVAPLPDIWGSKDTKAAKLARFRRELKYAVIHDVIGVLKWGLRHLCYSTSFSGTDSPLDWYPTFLSRSRSVKYPCDAFTKLLLPSLPASSRALLFETLKLVEAVAAQTEFNAMTPRKLCRMLGLYIFGLTSVDKEWSSWESLYEAWIEAGDTMEGCLKAYLRSQTTLPPRLAELVQSYPALEPRREIKVVRVRLETQGDWKKAAKVNDQRTGLVAGTSKKGGEEGMRVERRDPLVVLEAAFAASEAYEVDDDPEDVLWRVIVQQGKEGGAKGVLSEEVVRVLALVGLDEVSVASNTSAPVTPDSTRTRRRSISNGSPHGLSSLSEERTPTGSLSRGSSTNFPNKSVGNLQPKHRTVTPSWSDFTLSGFVEPANFDEFGRIALPEDAPVVRSSTVSRSTRSKYRSAKEGSSSSSDTAIVRISSSRILDISTLKIEEEFLDVWLDTLVDPTACASWPSFLIASLRRSIIPADTKIAHLFISDSLIPFVPVHSSSVSRMSMAREAARSVASLTESTMSGRWNKRMSGLFSSRGPSLGGSIRRRGRTEGDETAPALPRSVPISPPRAVEAVEETTPTPSTISKPVPVVALHTISPTPVVEPITITKPVTPPMTHRIPRVRPPTSTLPYIVSSPSPPRSSHSPIAIPPVTSEDEVMGIPHSNTTASLGEAPVIVAATMAVLGVATLVKRPGTPGSPRADSSGSPSPPLEAEQPLEVEKEEKKLEHPSVVVTPAPVEETPVVEAAPIVAATPTPEPVVDESPAVVVEEPCFKEELPIVEAAVSPVEPVPDIHEPAHELAPVEESAPTLEEPKTVEPIVEESNVAESMVASTPVLAPAIVESVPLVDPAPVDDTAPAPITTIVHEHVETIVVAAAAVVPLAAIAVATISTTPTIVHVEQLSTPVVEVSPAVVEGMKESSSEDTVCAKDEHLDTPVTPIIVPIALPEPTTPSRTPSKIALPPSPATPSTPTTKSAPSTASPSPNTKKFLGSKAIATFLRRKKSTLAPDVAEPTAAPEIEGKDALMKKGMVERKAIRKDEAVEVRSVKTRVLQIEAGRREEAGLASGAAVVATAVAGAAVLAGATAAVVIGTNGKHALEGTEESLVDPVVLPPPSTPASIPLPDDDDDDALSPEGLASDVKIPPSSSDVDPVSPSQTSFASISTTEDHHAGDTTITHAEGHGEAEHEVPSADRKRHGSIVSVDTQASFATALGSD